MSTSESPDERFFAHKMALRQFVTRGRLLALLALISVAGFIPGAVRSPADSPWQNSDGETGIVTLPVNIVVIEPVTSFEQDRRYTGTIIARRTADMSFERSARVTRVAVDDGDPVSVGQLLAELDIRHLKTEQQNLEAQRASAAALLEELEAGPRQEAIAAARAQVAELTAQMSLSERTDERTAQRHDRNSVSQQTLDDAKFALDAARARLNAARSQLEELEVGTRIERLAGQRSEVSRLDALLADIALDREDSILRAPFDGTVSDRRIDEGSFVVPGQSVLRVVESSHTEARIGLPVNSIRNLAAGDEFTLSADSGEITAVFARLLPELDLQTRTRTAVFDVVDSIQLPAPGEIVRMTLSQRIDAQGFWLPTTALSPGAKGLWSAFAVLSQGEHSIIERRDVEVLHTDGDRVLVRGTLTAGERFVADGIQRIIPGQRVTVAE